MAEDDQAQGGGVGEPRYQYQRIEKMIRDRVARKELLPGDQVESEYELAEKLGVHRFTVNKAVGNLVREGLLFRVKGKGTYVSEKMQLETAGEKSIGVLYTSSSEDLFTSHFNQEVIGGIRAGTGRDVLIFSSKEHSGGRGPDLNTVSWDKVDGMILFEVFAIEYLREVIDRGVPFVFVDNEHPDIEADCVVMDNYDAGYQTTKHLIDLGHRRIALANEPADVTLPDPAWQERGRGYEAALAEAGIEIEERYFAALPYRYASEKNEDIHAFFALDEPPTAVYCAGGDGIAITTIRIAEKYGLSVPADLSVAGFGGSQASEISTPQLTTVRASYHQMGRLAVERLIERIEKGAEPGKRIVLPVELVVRGSTGAPPAT